MSDFQSFAQVLEKKLRIQIERELHAEKKRSPSAASEIHSPLWTHLIGHLPPQQFKTAQKGQVYHRNRPKPRPTPPRPAHQFTAEQAQSFHFFKCHRSELADNFTKADLKSAFRKLALKLHPDQGGKADQFLALKLAFENLYSLVSG